MRFVFLLLLQAAMYAQRPDPAPYKPTAEETAAIRSHLPETLRRRTNIQD